ncbi:MAG: bifunctional folylpolyglutamate synthase/dihydrofolate synthase, partial [Cyanobacteria bacterium P01_F01_bin.42]
IEVGLGGRLDATNVSDRPLVSVITSVSLEHSQRLGSTLGEIAHEKAGVIKPDCPAVIGQLPAEAMAVVKARAQSLNSPLIQPPIARRFKSPQSDQEWAIAEEISYPLGLNGSIQLLNSALVISTILLLRERDWKIPDAAIQSGMGQIQWPGRLQWIIYEDKKLLIDGAHNPAAAQVLRDYVDRLKVPSIHWMMGMLATKDHRKVFEKLLRPGDRLSLVPVADHSSAQVQKLRAIAKDVCPQLSQVETFESLEQILALIPNLDHDGLNVLCGSLYLLGDFLAQLPSNEAAP